MVQAQVRVGGQPPRKGIILAVLGISQLMIILDLTIVNVALDNIRTDLAVGSQSDLQWIVTGYAVAFGGFLLLGGKLADRIGRRRIFVSGAILFGIASLVGGSSSTLLMLVAARGAQGLGAALMAPAALSIVSVVFEEGKERDRALAIWAAISAGGVGIGLLLGGVLTQYASWRWVLYVNVPIAAIAVVAALRFVPDSRDERPRPFDVVGATLITGGLMALVYGLVNAVRVETIQTAATLGLAVALLVAFVVVTARGRAPLLPRELLRYRNVVGANIGALLVASSLFAVFFFLVLWVRQINNWTPTSAGFAFLPVALFIVAGAAAATVLLGRVGSRFILVLGPLIAAAGLAYVGLGLVPDSSYAGLVLPALVLLAFGMGMTFVGLTTTALARIPSGHSGVAAAMLNSSQQVGGAVGLAILTAVANARTAGLAPDGVPVELDGQPVVASLAGAYDAALVEGWSLALTLAAFLLVVAALVMAKLVPSGLGRSNAAPLTQPNT